MLCLILPLLGGCSGKPSLTPAEQAEVDKYIKEHGRDAIAAYLSDERYSETDEKLILKYLKYFVSQGADVNIIIHSRDNYRDKGPFSPLILVAERKNVEMAKFLIFKGADINAPLYVIATARDSVADFEAIKFLVSLGADVNAIDGNGETPLDVAARLGNREAAEYLAGVAGVPIPPIRRRADKANTLTKEDVEKAAKALGW